MNIVGLVGKIITEPQLKPIGNSKVTNFLLSVKGAGKWSKDQDDSFGYGSFTIEAWGKLADSISKFCPKGTVISLSGSLKQDTWMDGTVQREKVKIVLSEFSFVNTDIENFKPGNDLEDLDEPKDHFDFL